MGFEVLLTVDKGIKHQQNIKAVGVAVILMRAKRSGVKQLRPLIPAVIAALQTIQPGEIVEIVAGAGP